MSRLVRVPWLVLVWVALWGRLSLANLISGVVVAVVLLTVVPVRGAPPPRYVLRPWALTRFVAHFVRGLVVANVVLTREILTRRDRIRTGVIEVPLVGVSDGLLTFVANMTALTPGTMTVEVQRHPARFYVHVLHLHDVELAREEIRTLERLAIRAFGSTEAIAALGAAELTAGVGAAELSADVGPPGPAPSPPAGEAEEGG